MSNSVRPHGLQPTRLLHPWDFPGKSTGVGCHCLLQRQCRRKQTRLLRELISGPFPSSKATLSALLDSPTSALLDSPTFLHLQDQHCRFFKSTSASRSHGFLWLHLSPRQIIQDDNFISRSLTQSHFQSPHYHILQGTQVTGLGLTWGSLSSLWSSQVVLVVKNLPASAGDVKDESSVSGFRRSPGGGNGISRQCSWTEEPGGLQSVGSRRVRHDWVSECSCIQLTTTIQLDILTFVSDSIQQQHFFFKYK